MKKFRLSAFVALCLIAGPTLANVLQPMPLRTQHARADVVLLVRSGQNTLCSVDAAMLPCVELVEPLYLKGGSDSPERAPHLVTYSRIPEFRVTCCEPGATYLMFLRRHGAYLYPVIGHWSIVRIDRSDDLPIN